MPTTYADFRARVSKLSVRPLAESEQGIKGLPVGRWGHVHNTMPSSWPFKNTICY